METKKMNAVTKVTTLNNERIPIFDANGKIYYIEKRDFCEAIAPVVGGLIGTATVEKDGLISRNQVKDSLQSSNLSNDIVYKIASFPSRSYIAIALRGIETAHGEIVEIFIYKPSDGKLHAKGNSPSWLTLKADSNQNVYASVVTGRALCYRLESLGLESAVMGITHVDAFPSDSIDIPFT